VHEINVVKACLYSYHEKLPRICNSTSSSAFETTSGSLKMIDKQLLQISAFLLLCKASFESSLNQTDAVNR